MPLSGGDLERRTAFLDVQFDHALVELSRAQTFAQFLAGAVEAFARLGLRRHQQVEQALFGIALGTLGHLVEALFAHHVDGDVHQVADHRLDVASDITDLGELAGFDLQERGVRELRQPPGQFGLADTRRPDHEDVLRHDLVGHVGVELLTPDAVAQRDGDGAFGVGLPDDVLIEFADDFARRQLVQQGLVVGGRAGR